HIAGADTAEKLLEWCHEIGITTITLFMLSTENLERSKDELNELFLLFYERLTKLLTDERVARFKIRVKALGRLELLTPEVRAVLQDLEEKTKDYNEAFLNIAIAY